MNNEPKSVAFVSDRLAACQMAAAALQHGGNRSAAGSVGLPISSFPTKGISNIPTEKPSPRPAWLQNPSLSGDNGAFRGL
jgi:hypothetical protein